MNWVASLDRLWVPPKHKVVTLSDEWWLARRGRLTASSRARSIAGPRAVGNFPKLKEKILAELAPDYVRQEQGQFAATDWGNEHERRALSTLELRLGLDDGESYEPGFLLHPTRPYAGGTPDLLIDRITVDWDDRDPYVCKPVRRCERTAVQVKCPYDATIHQTNLRTGKIGTKQKQYWYQLQWEGWITGADQLLFVSYDPRQRRAEQQLALIYLPVDGALQKIFSQRCDEFHAYMDNRVASSHAPHVDFLASYF